MKTIYLIRHGQTFMNRYDKIQGWCDTPLTNKGINGAKNLGENLKHVSFDVAITSDLRRAAHTCNYILEKNVNKDSTEYIATPYFREQYWGYFEGLDSSAAWRMITGPHGFGTRTEALKNNRLSQIQDWMKEEDPYHDAENSKEFWNRVNKGLEIINKLTGADKILLVTHAFLIINLWQKYGTDISPLEDPKNCSISIMKMHSLNNIKITSFNQTKL